MFFVALCKGLSRMLFESGQSAANQQVKTIVKSALYFIRRFLQIHTLVYHSGQRQTTRLLQLLLTPAPACWWKVSLGQSLHRQLFHPSQSFAKDCFRKMQIKWSLVVNLPSYLLHLHFNCVISKLSIWFVLGSDWVIFSISDHQAHVKFLIFCWYVE